MVSALFGPVMPRSKLISCISVGREAANVLGRDLRELGELGGGCHAPVQAVHDQHGVSGPCQVDVAVHQPLSNLGGLNVDENNQVICTVRRLDSPP